ncbi:MAG TPA: GT4 family glycosyltransferase PelF [Polyangia bacterium]|jgi:glycosyltransferase involved in cell wall biosynthesis|nr:GT4 family glycosyltransferase PelF [Polyangia bacterium]
MSVADSTVAAALGVGDDPAPAGSQRGDAATEIPDVCLLVEGTYPFVSGGVSSWVHDVICGHPELTFAVLYVGSYPGAHGEPRYQLPANVVALHRVFCQEAALAPLDGAGRATLREQIRTLRVAIDARPASSRVLAGFERMHVEGEAGTDVLAALASNDLTLPELLHGRPSFQLLTTIAERVAPDAPFLDLFWHYRAIFAPVLRLLAAPTVPARCYHAVATGYAGLLAALWSHRTGRPLMVTEHGIYARERDMELARADWIRDEAGGIAEPRSSINSWAPRVSPLRRLWSSFFRALSRIAYVQARHIITLSDANRVKQIADGAPPEKIEIVPNGVALQHAPVPPATEPPPPPAEERGVIALPARRLRVGFVGRVVPIKDLVTFVRACDIALNSVDVDARVIGPTEEDPGYAGRCRQLVGRLGRSGNIQFVGPMPPARIYGDLDLVVLTSFSEGQPLVILEAYAWGLPVVATDVGACREMIEGRGDDDRRIGPSGIVTRVAAPKETAAAIVRLARDVRLRWRMGAAGHQRVTAFYQRKDMLARYRALYTSLITEGGESR